MVLESVDSLAKGLGMAKLVIPLIVISDFDNECDKKDRNNIYCHPPSANCTKCKKSPASAKKRNDFSKSRTSKEIFPVEHLKTSDKAGNYNCVRKRPKSADSYLASTRLSREKLRQNVISSEKSSQTINRRAHSTESDTRGQTCNRVVLSRDIAKQTTLHSSLYHIPAKNENCEVKLKKCETKRVRTPVLIDSHKLPADSPPRTPEEVKRRPLTAKADEHKPSCLDWRPRSSSLNDKTFHRGKRLIFGAIRNSFDSCNSSEEDLRPRSCSLTAIEMRMSGRSSTKEVINGCNSCGINGAQLAAFYKIWDINKFTPKPKVKSKPMKFIYPL